MKISRISGLAGVALAAVLASAPVHAKVEVEKADGFVTRDSVVVKASKREAWLALISPSKWWNKAHTFSGDSANLSLMPKAGGCFCERMPEKDTKELIGLEGSVEHMRVLLSMPDQALRMGGNLGPLQSEPVNGVLTITLSDTKEGTRIVFEYAVGGFMRYEVPVIAKAVDGVISQQMMGLAALLGPVAMPEDAPKPGAKPEGKESDAGADGTPGEGASADDAAARKDPKISVDEAFGDLKGEK